MSNRKNESKPLLSAKEEVSELALRAYESAAHRLAFADTDFLLREELRPIRLQLELLKPELLLKDQNIHSTIVFFGSARLPEPEIAQQQLAAAQHALQANPDDKALQQAMRRAELTAENSSYRIQATQLAHMVASAYGTKPGIDFVVTTGGGPGIMEAANRGAFEAGAPSISLNIVLPHEQYPNDYVTPELTFQFHYFAIRKMHFFIRARAMIAFPGGFGTFDELFDALTLIQTHKMERLPVLLFNEKFWRRIINFEGLVDEGVISPEDLELFQYVETAEEAWQHILDFYQIK
ncbi:MAG: LOG family protein [Gammaproteobacteria bacterium]